MKLTATDGSAETELHSAAWNGDIEWVKKLIAAGVDVYKSNAAIIEGGADPQQNDSQGRIALKVANSHNNLEVIAYLRNST